MVAGAIALSAGPTVPVPALHGLTQGAVGGKLRRLHVRADFVSHFARAKKGTVVAQTPAPGTRVKEGSVIQVVLSKGPPPVAVPKLVGESSSAAVVKLHRIDLKAEVRSVPAPGTAPGIVTGQSAAAGHHLSVHSTVMLSVAETPTWKTVISFSGSGSAHSLPFHIRGSQWRVVYRMSYDGTCDFVLFCNGPSAQVLGVGNNSTDLSFGLNDGDTQTRVFQTGAGDVPDRDQAGLGQRAVVDHGRGLVLSRPDAGSRPTRFSGRTRALRVWHLASDGSNPTGRPHHRER